MKSKASRRFWECYGRLPPAVQQLAVKAYALWRRNPRHPSLHFKRLDRAGNRFSVRFGIHHRALGRQVEGGVEWVWIGTHAEYDQIIRRR